MKASIFCFVFFSVFTFSFQTLAVPSPSEVTGVDIFKASPISLSVEKHKGLVLVFLSAKCPCSDSHINEMKALSKDYPDFAFGAIHSNVDEEISTSKTYFERVNLPFPVIQDQNLQLADRFHALKTPHAFVLKANGDILYQGGVSNSHTFSKADRKFLREALDDIDHNRPVTTPEGRTLGCAISRGDKNVW